MTARKSEPTARSHITPLGTPSNAPIPNHTVPHDWHTHAQPLCFCFMNIQPTHLPLTVYWSRLRCSMCLAKEKQEVPFRCNDKRPPASIAHCSDLTVIAIRDHESVGFRTRTRAVRSRGLTLADDLDPMRATNYLIKQVEPRDPLN